MEDTLRYLGGFFIGVAVTAVYAMGHLDHSYERGKASVYMECAATGHSTFYAYQMGCQTSKLVLPVHERIYEPRKHATI